MKLRILTLAAIGLTASNALAQPVPGQRIPQTDPNGTYCREYQQMVTVAGKRQESYGTACMQPDGAWKILPSDVQQQTAQTTQQVEYLEEPRYVSQPVYMVPPTVYYEPAPVYAPYPYSYGSSFNVVVGSGRHYHRGRHRGHWHH